MLHLFFTIFRLYIHYTTVHTYILYTPIHTLIHTLIQPRDFVPDLVGADPLRPAAADRVPSECGRIKAHGDHGRML